MTKKESLKAEITEVVRKVGEALAGKANQNRLTFLRCPKMEHIHNAVALLPKAFPKVEWKATLVQDTPIAKVVRDAVLSAESGKVVVLYGFPGEETENEVSEGVVEALERAAVKTRILQLPILLLVLAPSVRVFVKKAPTLWKKKGGYFAWPSEVKPHRPLGQDPFGKPAEAIGVKDVSEVTMSEGGNPAPKETRKVLKRLRGDEAAAYLVKVARMHMDQGDLEQARLFLLRAVQIFSESANMAGMAEAYHLLGVGAQLRGDYEAAIEWFEQAIDSLRVVDDRLNLSEAIAQKGYVYYLRGQYEQAVKHFNEALEIDKALGAQERVSAGYRKIAMVLELTKKFRSAEELYQKSLDLEQQLGRNLGVARVYHHLGRVAEEQGDYEKALAFYNQSVDLKMQENDQAGLATSYHQFGNLYLKRGEFDKAIKAYDQALELEEELGDLQSMARTLAQLGVAYRDVGEVEKALRSLVRSYQIFQKLRSPVASQVLSRVEELQELVPADTFNRILREAAVASPV